MRSLRSTLPMAFVALALALASSAPAHDGNVHAIRLSHGRWFDGEHFVARDVFISGGVLHDRWTGEVEDTLDLSGKFVIPPLANAHTHDPSDTAHFAAAEYALLQSGVFAIKNPNLPGSSTPGLRARLARGSILEARFANGGLTSPGGHPVQIYEGGGHGETATLPPKRRWANDAYVEIADAAELAKAWPKVLAGKPDFIKVYLESSEHHAARREDPAMVGKRGIDPALLPEVVRRAHAAKLAVAVHVTSAEDVRTSVAAGADELAHLPLEPITDADARAIARAGMTVVTTLVSHRSASLPELDAVHRENLRRLEAAGVRLALGTDHPTRDVIDEAIEMQRLGVVTGAALVRLAAIETWRSIFPERPTPALTNGREASFLVLDADPSADIGNLRRIHLRVKRGQIVQPVAPTTKPSVAQAMLPQLMQGKLPAAFAVYDSLKRSAPEQYDFSEQALNQLGYAMLQHGQAKGAVAIFERNAQEFPRSANVFDSLADGYLAAGDTAKAVTAYRQVIENLPKNPQYPPGYAKGLEQRARGWVARREK